MYFLGFWSEQAQTMQSRLSDRNIEIQSMIKTLETLANASNEHVQIVETVKSEGVKVSTTYASAIKKLEPDNPLSIFTADENAKGIDIAIFRALETLVSLTTTNMENQRNQVLSNCH